MLSDDLRNKLKEMMQKDPKEAVKTIEKDPQILDILLRERDELDSERTKYIYMTTNMEKQLQEKARQLQTTQGALIGAGVLLLLSLFENSKS